MFAMHVVHSMFTKQFKDNEWEVFTRTIISDVKSDKKSSAPKWVDADRVSDYSLIKVIFEASLIYFINF